MQGILFRLFIVGFIFTAVGLHPPFTEVEYNLAIFPVVIVGLLIVEVALASRRRPEMDTALNQRVESLRQRSRINSSLSVNSRPAPTPVRGRSSTDGTTYDPIAASRLDHYYGTSSPSPDAGEASASSGGDAGGGGGD